MSDSNDSGLQWWQQLGYQQMTAEAYHAEDAVSASLLKRRTPAHALVPTETTPAMELGTATHAAILEPEKFNAEYSVLDADLRTKEGKARRDELIASGQKILKPDEWSQIEGMATSVHQHPEANALLAWGIAELSMFWTDPETGLRCKCRPDWAVDQTMLVDVKTCQDASPAGFARAVVNFGYHIQAAHYMAGTGADRFVFIAVESKPPYAVGVYELDALALDEGWRKRQAAIHRWNECKQTGVYRAYSDSIVTLSLPAWAIQGDE